MFVLRMIHDSAQKNEPSEHTFALLLNNCDSKQSPNYVVLIHNPLVKI